MGISPPYLSGMRTTALLHATALVCIALLLAPRPGCAQAQVTWDKAVVDELAWRERHGIAPFLRSGTPTGGYDLHYHRLEWSLDPAVNFISGTVRSHFTASAPLSTLRFDADSALHVSAVLHGADPLTWTHTPDGALLIDLPATLAPGTVDSVTVVYSGAPSGSGFGSFAVGTPQGNTAQWTLSEPYGARDWWPCKQDLNDKIDSIDVWLTVPAAYEGVSNGVLLSVTDMNGGTHRLHHWRHRYPIAYYLIATATCDYAVSQIQIPLPDDTVPMWTYAYPQDDFMAQLVAGDVAQQMPFFSDRFGTYPFADEQYGHAQFGWGGGMEHQTMTFMGGWNYELAAHELAHQWFGDKVTCGSWQDLWLNEGFATYLSGLCYETLAPQYWAGWKRAQVDLITALPDGSVHVSDTTDIARLFSARLTYRKGALVLHMLRWVCGDSAFFAGCRNYLDDPALAYGSARTSDLQAHLEAASGLDLDGFMADWFTGEGHPTYTVEWTQDAGGQVDLQLHQSSSHPSVDFFEMPVPLRFKNAAQDSLLVLDHSSSGQSFSLWLPFQADSALLDPDTWLISGQNLVLRVPSLAYTDDRAVLYPNPTDGDALLYLGGTRQGTAEVRITDLHGRVVRAWAARPIADRRVALPVADLSAGLYVVEADGLRAVLVKR